MRHLVERAGLSNWIDVDSAGTAAYHTGEPPDRRARAAGRRRGIEVGGRARQFRPDDWERFDFVIAMAPDNYDELSRLARPAELAKLHLCRSFDASSPENAGVPDPYYGGEAAFDEVLDLCEAACAGLIAHLRRQHGW